MQLLPGYKIFSQKLCFSIFFRDYLSISKLLLFQILFETIQQYTPHTNLETFSAGKNQTNKRPNKLTTSLSRSWIDKFISQDPAKQDTSGHIFMQKHKCNPREVSGTSRISCVTYALDHPAQNPLVLFFTSVCVGSRTNKMYKLLKWPREHFRWRN